jgi:sulfite exporter TauE/SafE
MLAFVVGTIPALGLVGAASAAMGLRWRRSAHWISGAAVILMGLLLILHAFPLTASQPVAVPPAGAPPA